MGSTQFTLQGTPLKLTLSELELKGVRGEAKRRRFRLPPITAERGCCVIRAEAESSPPGGEESVVESLRSDFAIPGQVLTASRTVQKEVDSLALLPTFAPALLFVVVCSDENCVKAGQFKVSMVLLLLLLLVVLVVVVVVVVVVKSERGGSVKEPKAPPPTRKNVPNSVELSSRTAVRR